jgi:hypothetical protein
MINKLAKSLVLLHTVFSLSALTLTLVVFLQRKDLGWIEPAKEVTEYNMPEGTPKSSVRHASVLDKSIAAYNVALASRNRTYSYVQPAINLLRQTEPHFPENHLYYVAKLKTLRDATGKIEVKHLKEAGTKLELPTFGKPAYEDAALENIVKSRSAYKQDLDQLYQEIDGLDKEIKKVVEATKTFTTQLTGTDDDNKYIQPGLYQLVDLEYKAQTQLKIEIDDIKPRWSKAIENAGNYRYRRGDLESTLNRLKGAVPAPKDAKKL